MVESSWRSPRGETSAKVSRSCWPMWFFRWRRPFSKEQIGMGQGLGVGRHKDVKGKKYYYCILLLLYSSHFFLLLNFDALERSRLNKCIVAGLRRSDRKWWVVHGLSDLLMDRFSAGLPQPVKVWFKTTHDGTGISSMIPQKWPILTPATRIWPSGEPGQFPGSFHDLRPGIQQLLPHAWDLAPLTWDAQGKGGFYREDTKRTLKPRSSPKKIRVGIIYISLLHSDL